MTDVINFKVFLTKDNADESKPEIKRFSIDNDVVSNYVYLREKLQVVFPKIRGKHFTITWKGN